MASDNKIIELIKQGDIAAFNILFKSVYLQLYIHCRKFIPDPEDAKDILQNVFLRFWEKDKGEIDYNGIDVDKIDSDNLLDNVTMVSQTTYLFDESIEENLRIAKPDATQEEIERACKMASVHDFIMSLPDGYKTQVGAMGDNLSAGEKQRILIARAHALFPEGISKAEFRLCVISETT